MNRISEPNVTSARQALNDRIKRIASSDWCHRIEIDAKNEFVPPENLRYRISVLRNLFGSLTQKRSVLVLNEVSGFYPALIKKAGASEVTANNPNRENCALMQELCLFTGEAFHILNHGMVVFDQSRIYVDIDHGKKHDFLFAQNQIWGLYNAAAQSFSDIVAACAHYVTDGLIFDWTDAKWANPPPPAEYNREAFHAALQERFEYVVACNEWLTLAMGKFPEMLQQESES